MGLSCVAQVVKSGLSFHFKCQTTEMDVTNQNLCNWSDVF